jgi:hypothetical protein
MSDPLTSAPPPAAPPPLPPMEKGASNFLRGLLLALGILWMLLTGGCTVFFAVIAGAMGNNLPRNGNEAFQLIGLFGTIGAVCMSPGIVLVVISRLIGRRDR